MGNEVEEIKERLDVAEIVGGYVPLKQAGRNLKGVCPFHNEKSPSLMVSPEKGIWHCFGCGEGGDIYKFVMKMEGLDFRAALEMLARRAGVELSDRKSGMSSKEKERLYEATALAAKYYQATLPRNATALDYIVKKRHLTRQTVVDFQIGYAPDTWDALGNFLVKRGFNEEELIKAGLASKKAGRSSFYDMFRGRIMFPICDASGRPVGFTARVLGDGVPKYLNTPQTPLYDKSRVIYGLHLAKEAIREHNEAVLVEGNMDVVASHQAGSKQVVAASGTALTLDQLKALSRLTKNIKLAFDQDGAGIAATERAIELAGQLGITLSVIVIEGAKDPDELIAKSPNAWAKAISASVPVVDYLFKRFESDFDLESANGKKAYTDRLATTLRRLVDPVERDHYVKLLAEKLSINEKAINEKIDRTEVKTAVPPQPRVAAVAAEEARVLSARERLERSILSLAIVYPETRLSLDDLTTEHLSDPSHQEILVALQQGATNLEKALPNAKDYVKILALQGEESYADLPPADRSLEAFELVARLSELARRQRQTKVSEAIRVAEAAGDVELRSKLMQEFQSLMMED